MSTDKKIPFSPDDLVDTQISGYKIVQRIKESLVYLAFRQDIDHQVAIKIFYPNPYAGNQQLVIDRLDTICKLEDPNIIKIYEVGNIKGAVYCVMEYIPGENLYDLMKRNPRLHWGAAAEIGREITQGLVAAHKLGILHLSLHPDRILLGKDGQIKVNFCNEGLITPSKEIVHYVAPELFLGQDIQKSSDVYSLGTIIYHIVTGNPPVAGKEPKEIALIHRQLSPVIPSYGVADVPHPLSLLLERTMTKKLEQRYSNCFELLAALNNFLRNEVCEHIYCAQKKRLETSSKRYRLGSYKELVTKVVKADQDNSFVQEIHRIEEEFIKNSVPSIKMSDSLNESQSKSISANKNTSVIDQATQYVRKNLGRNYSHILFACFCSFSLSIFLMLILIYK